MADDQQEKLLPIANVGRIMKQILPPNAKISKEAKETMQECASEFISFVTCEASDKCHKENRKTVNGDDICWALSSLGFDNFGEAMMRYLHKLREFDRKRANQTKGSPHDEDDDHRDEESNHKGGSNGHSQKEIQKVAKDNNLLKFRLMEKGESSHT